ncbi:MAG: hypothetical protein EBZ91_13935, partial [Gammaproteobacteria bacterium]|nr:hypothetical protein [Gammaproteobacteria bacterium]
KLQAGIGSVIPQRSAVTIAAGATLDINNLGQTVGSLAGAGTVTNSGGTATTLTFGRDDTSTTFSGVFNAATAANLALTKLGAGVFTINSSSDSLFTGALTLNGGTFALDFANVAAPASLTTTAISTASTNITVASTAGLAVGRLVTGTGIAANSYITAINGNIITLNAAATVSGMIAGESLVVSGTSSGKNVGSYTDNLTAVAGPSTLLANYDVSFSHGTMTITPYQLSVDPNTSGPRMVATANNKVYDTNTLATGVIAVRDLLGTDALTASATSAAFDNKNAGPGKTVTFTGVALAGDPTTLANYSLGGVGSLTTTATITPAPATVTAIAETKVFNGLLQTQSATVSGYLEGGNSLTGLAISGLVSQSGVGAYQSNLTSSNPNYRVTLINAPFTIVPNTPAVPETPPNILPPLLPFNHGGGVNPVSIEPGAPAGLSDLRGDGVGVSAPAASADAGGSGGASPLAAERSPSPSGTDGSQQTGNVRNYDLT